MIVLRQLVRPALRASVNGFRCRINRLHTTAVTAAEKAPPDDAPGDQTRKKTKPTNAHHLPAIFTNFENVSDKNRETYLNMVTIFEEKSVHRRNHVEFIYAALRNMEDFNVQRDIEVYKALINVMPKGKFIPTNMFQSEFMHYPKQQQCIIDLLEQMEDYGVIPDYEMEDMLVNVFGRRGHPVRKYWRMMYWMPKFKNLSPWPLPNPVPDETLELARMAVERMCTVDVLSRVEVLDTTDIEESIDKTWVVSGMSPEQQELINKHDRKKPMYIEGPYLMWLRHKCVNYFVLRADANTNLKFEEDEVTDNDDVSHLNVPLFGAPAQQKRVALKRSVHQQDDGTIFAICATGTSTKDSLLSWIRFLDRNGDIDLGNTSILFKFKSRIGSELTVIDPVVR